MTSDLLRRRALDELQRSEVLMRDGHFDYGNGFHGRVYLNPHRLFLEPSTIWRVSQDLLDLMSYDTIDAIDVVAGPATGGALLAHTIAGLLDGRRPLSRRPCQFAPFNVDARDGLTLRRFYRSHLAGLRVLLVDDVRNTGTTFHRCAELVRDAGATVIGTAQIYDRGTAAAESGVPNYALVEYSEAENVPAADCPMCRDGRPITEF